MKPARKRHRYKRFAGNRDHLERLLDALRHSSPKRWNQWRRAEPEVRPDLRGLDLKTLGKAGVKLGECDLSGADLRGARLREFRAWQARLAGADLRDAILDHSDLSFSVLRGANLAGSRLVLSNLTLINGAGAIFRDTNLSHAILNGANLRGADLSGARVAGLSTWGIQVDDQTDQKNLFLEEVGDFLEDLVDEEDAGTKPVIGRVNHLEAVYLIHLLKDKAKFKTVIDAMTSTVVLILGNFNRGRLQALHRIEATIRSLGYVPVIFDFDEPEDRDLIETVALLAGLACFVIADMTTPRSAPLEAMLIVPQLRVPFVTVMKEGERPLGMLQPLQAKYPWVLPTWTYTSQLGLQRLLKSQIVPQCEQLRERLRLARQRRP